MGHARVTDLAHRAESLLDLLRRGGRPASDELLQLLFRARDALEQAVEFSVVGREDEIDVAEVVADLDGAATRLGAPPLAPPPPRRRGERRGEGPPPPPGGGGGVQRRARAAREGGRRRRGSYRGEGTGPGQPG